MSWIKSNYDQFILGIMALILVGLSAYLGLQAWGFQQVFDNIRGQVIHHNEIPPIDMTAITSATAAVINPAKWDITKEDGSLFISEPYIATNGILENPGSPHSLPLHPPVPNSWLIAHKLNILDPNVLNEDPDGDGFTNLDEWKGVKGDGSDSTDPLDKNSHPPYWTKLRLVQYIKQPFRLKFNSWDGNPGKPDSLSFQIDTVDILQPTQFLKLNDVIAGTKFKIVKFEKKEKMNPSTGSTDDVSELTVQNTETGVNVVLVNGQVANSPDSYALFRYLWNNTGFRVKKGQEFVLLPESTLRYKLIDIQEDKALISTPKGEQIWVPKLEQP
ncbi:MAG TPA: Amuc_1099 family pilus-like system protein [Chthoniobacteraceae bacterium]|jgi:hypothetical protein|nr:Amuc_1099 family pilus-like system protein [Chthoniobacteraceae bacterium]